MQVLRHLFEKNTEWAEQIRHDNPMFFQTLTRQQSPEYLWIGCADSRVPANQIVGLLPGELFVHRNIANVVNHTDLNCLSVIQYAVDVLKVKHIIVCGHYGCGGIRAAMENKELGLIDNWLRQIQELYHRHESALDSLLDAQERVDRMCELNVIEQVYNVSRTTIVQKAWQRGQILSIHGWIYRIQDGLLHDLQVCTTCSQDIAIQYQLAINRIDSGEKADVVLQPD